MCMLGDGTTNIGAFHESLNLAAIWNLPIVYVIVNNRLGMGTTVERAAAEPELHKRACSYRMANERVDGDDVLAVREAAAAALERARVQREPTLLETMSYRLRGHSVVDPATYRSKEEAQRINSLDPLPAFRARLIEAGVLDEADATALEESAEQQVADAVAFADGSPDPEVSDLFEHAYATPVPNLWTGLPGDPVVPDAGARDGARS